MAKKFEFISFNKSMSEKEANKAFNSKGAIYPNTSQNKQMMKSQVDKLLRKLQGKK